MNDFVTGWEAVDQTIAVLVLMVLLASFVAWVLYGEHKFGGRR